MYMSVFRNAIPYTVHMHVWTKRNKTIFALIGS